MEKLDSLLSSAQWVWPSIIASSVIGGSILYLYFRSQKNRKIQVPKNISLNKQSVSVSNKEGYDIRCSPLSDVDGVMSLTTTEDPSVQTTYDNFLRGLNVSNDGPCLGYRTSDTSGYTWIKYGETLEKALNFGSGLVKLGLKAGVDNNSPTESNTTFVGIYAKNCPEWVITELGAVSQSIAIVPLYDTLGTESVSFIVNQAKIELIVCDSSGKAAKIVDHSQETPSLRRIIVFENSVDTNLIEKAGTAGLKVTTFQEVVELGARDRVPTHLPTPECLYIVCYTSGTTGLPKGVMISHKNIVLNASAGIRVFNRFGIHLEPGSTVISYLPLAHMFEQMCNFITFYYGSKIGYFRGHVTGLLDDMKVLKPSLFPVVPRLLNRLYDKVQSNLEKASPLARGIFKLAYNAKLKEMKQGIVRKNSFWDRLVFQKLQKELGGNVEIMVTGSAPIAAEVLELSRVTLGSIIMEGYGQTECTAMATLSLPGDMSTGHVGGPAPCAHIRLVDVPELEYWAEEGKGEICIRGPTVTSGYFNDPEKTAETLDEEGWLHTGDVGMWLPNGTLRVVDRKKHIFKLAQGEYVAPEKIESVYLRAPVVQQVYVDGNSLERFLVAIVVPDESILCYWFQENADENQQKTPTLKEMCEMEEAKKHVLSEMQIVGKENGLNSIEQVKAIHLSPEAFTLENGLLTPTMKSKRPQLRKYFAATIEQLYKDNN